MGTFRMAESRAQIEFRAPVVLVNFCGKHFHLCQRNVSVSIAVEGEEDEFGVLESLWSQSIDNVLLGKPLGVGRGGKGSPQAFCQSLGADSAIKGRVDDVVYGAWLENLLARDFTGHGAYPVFGRPRSRSMT